MSPPTDSLYKFLCISGLVLIIYCNYSRSALRETQYKEKIEIIKDLIPTYVSDSFKLAEKDFSENRDSLWSLKLREIEMESKIRAVDFIMERDDEFYADAYKAWAFYENWGRIAFTIGFIFWLGNIQFYQDRLLKLEAIGKGLAVNHNKEMVKYMAFFILLIFMSHAANHLLGWIRDLSIVRKFFGV